MPPDPPLPAVPQAIAPAATPPDPAQETAAAYARQSLSAATLRAYRADWNDFRAFCQGQTLNPLPAAPATVATYLASLAPSHGRAALQRRLAAIGQAHRLKGLPWAVDATVRHTLRGILRQHGTPPRRAAALTTAEIRKLVATCQTDLTGLRDRALLLLGYAGALRRAELVAIAREDIHFTPDGLRLLIPRSKTDTAGQGAELGIPRGERRETCPVRALQAWLEASGCEYGPVFRRIDMWGGLDDRALNPNAVRQILLRRAQAAGLKVSAAERLSPHGLRAGFVTTAYQAGVPDEAIMAHTRHRDHATMRRYVRRARLLTESPAKKLGL
jgi:integrase